MKRIPAILLLFALFSCGYDQFGGLCDVAAGTDILPNADIAWLMERYLGNSATIGEDIVVEGYVSANDRSGNLYRSFVIDDGTGAVEIYAGISELHNYFPEGRRVVVSLRGLALGSYNGVLQLGLKVNSYSDYKVEDFGSQAIMERYIKTDTEFRNVVPVERSLSAFRPQDCGRIVRTPAVLIDDVPEGATWGVTAAGGASPSTGVWYFRDASGNRVAVVTSGYANFAAEAIPRDSVRLTGILMRGKFDGSNESYGVRLREISDVEK